MDRSFASGVLFTTQPARHNEFNVNLAFIDAKHEGARVHGRVALQAGTSVRSNYAGEPATGVIGGHPGCFGVLKAVAGRTTPPFFPTGPAHRRHRADCWSPRWP